MENQLFEKKIGNKFIYHKRCRMRWKIQRKIDFEKDEKNKN